MITDECSVRQLFQSDRNSLRLDRDAGYRDVYICQSLSNYNLKWMPFIVSKLYLKKLILTVKKRMVGRKENTLWSKIMRVQILTLPLAKRKTLHII